MRQAILAMGLVTVFGSVCPAVAANANARLALVIGNSAYQSAAALPNPANDARTMAEFLGSAGFEVTAVQDLGQSEMRRAVGEFADKVASRGSDSTALMFYAGHGLQVDGENFLVPVDAKIARESDVPLQAVRLADLMNTLAAAPAKTRIVMLDACRNNPYSEINKVTGRGLAIADAPRGSILSYSTAPGTEAEDGPNTNSPYTSALVVAAKEPGLPIEQAFKRVRWSVHESTSGRQTPWESSSLTDEFSFFPGGASTAGSTASLGEKAEATATKVTAAKSDPTGRTSTARSVASWERELRPMQQSVAYETIVRDDTLEAYQAYLKVFKSSPLQARVRTIVERRTVMIAWYGAFAANTPEAYRDFITRYPGSDLAATAERLAMRASVRLFPTALACIAPTPAAPVAPKAKKEKRAEPKKKVTRTTSSAPPPQPSRASSGPDPATVMTIIGVGVGIGSALGSRSHSQPSAPSSSHHSSGCCGR